MFGLKKEDWKEFLFLPVHIITGFCGAIIAMLVMAAVLAIPAIPVVVILSIIL